MVKQRASHDDELVERAGGGWGRFDVGLGGGRFNWVGGEGETWEGGGGENEREDEG